MTKMVQMNFKKELMKIKEIIEEVKIRKIIEYEKYGKKQNVTK